jgi:hypothetical protein
MENRYRTVPDARLDARAVDQKMQIGIVRYGSLDERRRRFAEVKPRP